ncbi:MAG: response regulator [Desulfobacter sp.]
MTQQFSDLRFLVIDDSRSMRRIVRKFLENSGVTRIAEADNGQSALEIIRFQTLDMIISDLNMPVMSGMELLEILKAEPELENICFIMLTVEAIQKTMNQALKMGADAYIVKPVTEKLFIEQLKQVLWGVAAD